MSANPNIDKPKPDASERLLALFIGPSGPGARHFDVERIAYLQAAQSSAEFFAQNFPMAPNLRSTAALLKHAVKACSVEGFNVELGVNTGTTAKIIVDTMGPGTVLHGFDSFEGLPEDWTHFQKAGRFDRKGLPPDLPESVICHKGWFDKTLPAFAAEHKGPLRFLHVDSDLYSSAKTGFDVLGDRIVAGTVIVFDEYFNYPGWQNHEHRAWTEFVAASKVRFEYLGWASAVTSLAVRVL